MLRHIDEPRELALVDVAAADIGGRDLGLLGEDTRGELLGAHFEREEADLSAIGGLAVAVGRDLALPGARHVEGDVGARARSCPWPDAPAMMIRSDFCRPPISRSRSVRPVAVPDSVPSRLIGFAGHLDGFGQRLVEGLEAAIVAALLGEIEELLFGFLDLLGRRHLDIGLIGDRGHLLADLDQRCGGWRGRRPTGRNRRR